MIVCTDAKETDYDTKAVSARGPILASQPDLGASCFRHKS